jgi:hypothetical protein
MDIKAIRKLIRKFNNSTFRLTSGNCGAFAIGLASALGMKDCELVWAEDRCTYGIFHCMLFHKPTNTYVDGDGVFLDGEGKLLNDADGFIDAVVYRKPLNKKTITYVLKGTVWTIHPNRFKKAYLTLIQA